MLQVHPVVTFLIQGIMEGHLVYSKRNAPFYPLFSIFNDFQQNPSGTASLDSSDWILQIIFPHLSILPPSSTIPTVQENILTILSDSILFRFGGMKEENGKTLSSSIKSSPVFSWLLDCLLESKEQLQIIYLNCLAQHLHKQADIKFENASVAITLLELLAEEEIQRNKTQKILEIVIPVILAGESFYRQHSTQLSNNNKNLPLKEIQFLLSLFFRKVPSSKTRPLLLYLAKQQYGLMSSQHNQGEKDHVLVELFFVLTSMFPETSSWFLHFMFPITQTLMYKPSTRSTSNGFFLNVSQFLWAEICSKHSHLLLSEEVNIPFRDIQYQALHIKKSSEYFKEVVDTIYKSPAECQEYALAAWLASWKVSSAIQTASLIQHSLDRWKQFRWIFMCYGQIITTPDGDSMSQPLRNICEAIFKTFCESHLMQQPDKIASLRLLKQVTEFVLMEPASSYSTNDMVPSWEIYARLLSSLLAAVGSQNRLIESLQNTLLQVILQIQFFVARAADTFHPFLNSLEPFQQRGNLEGKNSKPTLPVLRKVASILDWVLHKQDDSAKCLQKILSDVRIVKALVGLSHSMDAQANTSISDLLCVISDTPGAETTLLQFAVDTIMNTSSPYSAIKIIHSLCKDPKNIPTFNQILQIDILESNGTFFSAVLTIPDQSKLSQLAKVLPLLNSNILTNMHVLLQQLLESGVASIVDDNFLSIVYHCLCHSYLAKGISHETVRTVLQGITDESTEKSQTLKFKILSAAVSLFPQLASEYGGVIEQGTRSTSKVIRQVATSLRTKQLVDGK